jgi:hypothetical protein
MRAGLVISRVVLSWGTLKSTRMRTRLPLRSTSVMESLLERDILLPLDAVVADLVNGRMPEGPVATTARRASAMGIRPYAAVREGRGIRLDISGGNVMCESRWRGKGGRRQQAGGQERLQ